MTSRFDGTPGVIDSSILRHLRDVATEGFHLGGGRSVAEREAFATGATALLTALVKEGALVVMDDESEYEAPYPPDTTVEEIVGEMTTNHRSPGRDELQALIQRVVANTCDHLHHERLGTLTVERYIVKENG